MQYFNILARSVAEQMLSLTLHAWKIFLLLVSSADFFQNELFQKILSAFGKYPNMTENC